MTAIKAFSNNRRLCSFLLVGTVLGGVSVPAYAQEAAPLAPAPVTAPLPATGTVRSITVTGNQRIEAETILSYMALQPGEPYDRERIDQALRDLYATELLADVQIRDNQGALTVEVRENPVINRIILEGNDRLKDDKINPEIRLAPRQIFTRSKARADVARIIELYRRQGRYAARVEPQIVELDQNRVDVVFEIDEGPVSKVRQINIIGNEAFSDGELRGEMSTQQARLLNILSGGTSYDPDRLAYDQQLLRQFYLTEGYADFRVISAVAELTPDRRDFVITYVVEEGERYKFGDIAVDSEIRDFKPEEIRPLINIQPGDWYNAKRVEDAITGLNETAGLFGYAFADVQPQIERNRENLTMGVTFEIAEAPRVYVERIDINGNTNTRDEVIRREFRLAEGDAFNSVRVSRSRDRIQSLGFFQDNFEIEQTQGATPDRVILTANVEERPTGELNLSAGFSSLERFLVNVSIAQRNFMGKGQTVRASANYSTYSKSLELGFTEPYVFDRNIAAGVDLYRRDYNSFNFVNQNRNTTYEQVVTGGQLRAGVPLTEYAILALRYSLNFDDISLNRNQFFTDPDGPAGPQEPVCDPLLAGRYLCDTLGKRTTSSLGYSLSYNTTDNRLRPTRGESVLLGQDFAGIGGDVNYLRTRLEGRKYWTLGSGFVLSAGIEGGYIHSFEDSRGPGIDPVRLPDRFFLGEPDIRGFDIRGVGPRVQRRFYQVGPDNSPVLGEDGNPLFQEGRGAIVDDALGGRAFYLGRVELEIPLGSGARELGLRPSVFLDVGSVFGVKRPILNDLPPGDPRLSRPILNANGLRQCTTGGTTPVVTPLPAGSAGCPIGSTLIATQIQSPFREFFLGDTWKPRVSIGFGVNWNSPFGPFRIDIAKALITQPGDDTKLITFNVGTAF